MIFLPRRIDRVGVPPIKCQGIKTKLVPFISESICWNGKGRWIEPFLGSGVVLFNIQPRNAIASDTNKHVIRFYQDIQSGDLDELVVKDYLYEMGKTLFKQGESFYYEARQKFNQEGGSLELLFLNRSCFNGIMRFNGKGGYNVPFGHKPDRFRQAYVTKVCNQVKWVREVMKGKNWEFRVGNWKDIIIEAQREDFIYMDPPYIGRHADYYNNWTEEEAVELAKVAQSRPCGFALSMWQENKYRKNRHIDDHWCGHEIKTFKHFYHVGSKETLRNDMKEALVIRQGSCKTS